MKKEGLTNTFVMFGPPPVERKKTMAFAPVKRKKSPQGLPANFEKTIISLEFKAEKGEIDQAQIHELIELYTKASNRYDSVKDKDHAELYR